MLSSSERETLVEFGYTLLGILTQNMVSSFLYGMFASIILLNSEQINRGLCTLIYHFHTFCPASISIIQCEIL